MWPHSYDPVIRSTLKRIAAERPSMRADRRTPLHPPVLSEGAASLLPNEVRPALLWTIMLDHRGQTVAAEVARGLVPSRAQLSYDDAQAEIDGGSPRETLALL